MLEESSVYQDIYQKGARHGEQRGVVKGERKIALRQLERRFGKLSPAVRRQIERLAVAQLEELCEALLDFKTQRDMVAWFKQQAAKG